MSERIKKKEICITIVLTLLTGLVCFFLKRIYPFGTNTIDYHDMAQEIVAFYCHVYDFLHGTKPVFFDYYTALGSNQAMSTAGCSNFSIFNLFFLFVQRDRILESLSFFLLIKMIFMAISMYILLSLNKGIRSYVHVILSVGYGFCGFVLTLYTINQWLDVAFLFPLILVGLNKLVCSGKPALYVVFLSLSLINSYYLSFMILIYIILILGTKIISDRIFDKRSGNYHLFSLGIGTVASLGISSFIMIPQLYQTLSSARYNNEIGENIWAKYMTILSTTEPAYTSRWFSLLGLSFAAAIITTGLITHHKNKKMIFNIGASCFIVLLEIFLESTNLIWHFGSYIQYPIRNGFMIYVTIAMCAGYILSESDTTATDLGTESIVPIKPAKWLNVVICTTVCIVSFFILVFGIHYYSENPGLMIRKVFHLLAGLMVFTFSIYVALNLYKKGVFARYSSVLVIAEILLYCYIFIGRPTFIEDYTESFEQSGEYVKLCNELADAFELEPENIYRMKNPDESLNANYGFVIRRPVLSNWTHLISPDLQDASKKWGYSIQFTRLLDAGGTVFSDALIGIRNIITRIPQDEKLYTLIDTADIKDGSGNKVTYYLYEPVYTIPWVNTIASGSSIHHDKEDTVSLHNKLFNALGGEGELAEYVSKFKAGQNNSIRLTIQKRSACYMLGNCADQEYKNTSVRVNGKDILIPSIGEYDNTLYPAYFNCNGIYLGSFENEPVDIEIISDNEGNGQDYTIKIMTIDLDKLEDLCDRLSCDDNITTEKNRMIISKYVSGENKSLLIPLAYDEGFSATDNDQKIELCRYAGLFTKIPATNGENRIIITFTPKGAQIGAVISLVFLLITIVYIKVPVIFPETAERISGSIFMVLYCGIMTIMYIIPVIYMVLAPLL